MQLKKYQFGHSSRSVYPYTPITQQTHQQHSGRSPRAADARAFAAAASARESTPMLLLFETPAGYSLFKVKDEKKLSDVEVRRARSSDDERRGTRWEMRPSMTRAARGIHSRGVGFARGGASDAGSGMEARWRGRAGVGSVRERDAWG